MPDAPTPQGAPVRPPLLDTLLSGSGFSELDRTLATWALHLEAENARLLARIADLNSSNRALKNVYDRLHATRHRLPGAHGAR
jgi:hypothetical protein